MKRKNVHTVEEYLSTLPKDVRSILERWRKTIKQAAPQAEEVISYNIPAFKWNGILVWYAAHKEHIGFYPRPSAMTAFKHRLAGYRTSKGAIQFPIDKPVPARLVQEIVKFRVRENEEGQRRRQTA